VAFENSRRRIRKEILLNKARYPKRIKNPVVGLLKAGGVRRKFVPVSVFEVKNYSQGPSGQLWYKNMPMMKHCALQ
jgi:hypothetical protein